MNQIYSKTRYLFLLLGFLICSVGMAQSPLQKTKTGNVPMAVQSPSANQKKIKFLRKELTRIPLRIMMSIIHLIRMKRISWGKNFQMKKVNW